MMTTEELQQIKAQVEDLKSVRQSVDAARDVLKFVDRVHDTDLYTGHSFAVKIFLDNLYSKYAEMMLKDIDEKIKELEKETEL